jgi:hypothetical protein
VILSIDSGVHECACARFHEDRLVCTWHQDPRGTLEAISYDAVIVERPQYDARSDRARPADLMALAWSGALLAGRYARGARVVELTPREWKGSEPKPISHKRAWAVLDAQERAVLGGDATGRAIVRACEKGALKRWAIAGAACYPRSFKTHNVLDAAAMGLTHLGRMRKVG